MAVEKIKPEDVRIHELDAPPTAYFDLPVLAEHVNAEPHGELVGCIRLIHRVLMTQGTDARAALDGLADEVRQELLRVASESGVAVAYLWWRIRPEDDGHNGYARLSTLPDLPVEFWKRVSTTVV